MYYVSAAFAVSFCVYAIFYSAKKRVAKMPRQKDLQKRARERGGEGVGESPMTMMMMMKRLFYRSKCLLLV